MGVAVRKQKAAARHRARAEQERQILAVYRAQGSYSATAEALGLNIQRVRNVVQKAEQQTSE